MNNSEIFDLFTLINIDDEDFVFRVNGKPYLIRTGETKRFPEFMARLAVKHLVDKMLNKAELPTNHPTKREELANRIIVDVEKYEQPHEETLEEEMDRRVEEANKKSDLDAVMERRRGEVEKVNLPPIDLPKAVIEPKKQEVKKTVAKPKTEEEFPDLKKKAPFRETLIAYAKNTMLLDTDDKKFIDKIGKMTDAELAIELDYQEEK